MAPDLLVLLPALAAGLLVVTTHVPLGREVIRRGIIFIDLAVAQIAVLGVVGARTLEWGGVAATQAAAFGSAVAGSLLLYACERRWPRVQEALIGIAFILATAAALLLLFHNPHGGEQFRELLSGQILWVTWRQVAYVAILYLLVLIAWSRFAGDRGRMFYLLFAITVTASVQLVGVLLVFASLVIPALLVTQLETRPALVLAYGHAVTAYVLGFLLSTVLDLPTGPVIVWMLAIIGLGFGLLSRSRS